MITTNKRESLLAAIELGKIGIEIQKRHIHGELTDFCAKHSIAKSTFNHYILIAKKEELVKDCNNLRQAYLLTGILKPNSNTNKVSGKLPIPDATYEQSIRDLIARARVIK